MKKLTVLLLSLLCLFTVACGGPSAKEEAERLHKDHMLATKAMWNDDFVPKLKKIHNEIPEEKKDVEAAKLAEEYKPKLEKAYKKIQAETVQEQNKHLSELIQMQDKNSLEFLNLLIVLKDKQNLKQQNWNQDFANVTMRLFNTKLEYDNEYSKITTGKGTYELTLANFQKIHKGDTYQQVAETFKMPGVLRSSNSTQLSYGPHTLDTWEWELNDSRVDIIFENNKANLIHQFNLK
nr:MAG TPA: protein binding protein [Caudoviricetes sp.]